MYVIGMTGGVGSGKTQAACLLKEIASAELLIADELGHVAMEKGTDGYEEIIESFGTDILDADGQISNIPDLITKCITTCLKQNSIFQYQNTFLVFPVIYILTDIRFYFRMNDPIKQSKPFFIMKYFFCHHGS